MNNQNTENQLLKNMSNKLPETPPLAEQRKLAKELSEWVTAGNMHLRKHHDARVHNADRGGILTQVLPELV